MKALGIVVEHSEEDDELNEDADPEELLRAGRHRVIQFKLNYS